MVHFDFIVDDIDAENIMFSMMDAETQILTLLCRERSEENRPSYIEWYEGRIAYLRELQSKMKNTRVEDIHSHEPQQ